MKSTISSYINLTKPTIVLLFTLTGLTALIMEGSLLLHPLQFWIIALGITLTAGSANALNMFFDRDIDELMRRTRQRRPLPLKKISPQNALIFGIILGMIATGLLFYFGSLLSAALGVFTIFFYVVIYTLYLKRRTPYNIVIGGIAGSTAPLIGWAAAHSQISQAAWLMFLIIFLWTPPHFWALALVVQNDYKDAKIPMLPVVAGERRTRWEIFIYTLILIPLTFAPVLTEKGGSAYLVGSALLGLMFFGQSLKLMRKKDHQTAYRLFWYSIVYLLMLFLILAVGAYFHQKTLAG